jgi:hypothetical protein
MESKQKSLGRAYLVGKLRERGLSRRDAVRILNVVLDEMAPRAQCVRAASSGPFARAGLWGLLVPAHLRSPLC